MAGYCLSPIERATKLGSLSSYTILAATCFTGSTRSPLTILDLMSDTGSSHSAVLLSRVQSVPSAMPRVFLVVARRPAPSRIHRISYRLAECHYEESVREHGALCLLRGRCGMVYSIDTHSLDPVDHRRIGRSNPRRRRQCEANESKSALSIVEDSSLRC